MSGWRASSSGIVTGTVVSLALAACGGNARQDAHEANGHFNVEVLSARFPASQSLAEHSRMVIAVRNADTRTIPDVAVTINDANYGSAAQAFAETNRSPNLASSSRPVWIVDRGPGPSVCGYSCSAGGAGGAVTAYAGTWALGALAPGQTATFAWKLTAVKAGTHLVHYQVAAGLNGKAIAQLAGGQRPAGTFRVTIHSTPQQSYVDDRGKIVRTPGR